MINSEQRFENLPARSLHALLCQELLSDFSPFKISNSMGCNLFRSNFPWASFARSCRPTSVGSSREEFLGKGSHCPDQSGKINRESWIFASSTTVGWIRMRLIDLNDYLLPINGPILGWLPSKSPQRRRESRILHRQPLWVRLEWGWDRGPDQTHAPLLAPGGRGGSVCNMCNILRARASASLHK